MVQVIKFNLGQIMGLDINKKEQKIISYNDKSIIVIIILRSYLALSGDAFVRALDSLEQHRDLWSCQVSRYL